MAIVVESVSSNTQSAGVSVVVTKPTGLAVGDLMLACAGCSGDGTGSRSVLLPSGWTGIQNIQTTEGGSRSMYKIADASDVASSDFTFSRDSGSFRIYAGILRISGHNPLNPINTSNANSGVAFLSSTITINGVTPTVANNMVVLFGAALGSFSVDFTSYAITTNNPSSWTEAFDVVASTDTNGGVGYATRPETTATGDGTISIGTNFINAGRQGHIIIVEPLPINTTPIAHMIQMSGGII